MSQEVMQAMQHWINQIVMGEGLCPFARTSILNNHFAMQMSQANSFEGAYQDFLGGLQHFASDHGEHLESAALVVPYALSDFNEYLECLGACEQAIEDAGLSGEVQLASFHPKYMSMAMRQRIMLTGPIVRLILCSIICVKVRWRLR